MRETRSKSNLKDGNVGHLCVRSMIDSPGSLHPACTPKFENQDFNSNQEHDNELKESLKPKEPRPHTVERRSGGHIRRSDVQIHRTPGSAPKRLLGARQKRPIEMPTSSQRISSPKVETPSSTVAQAQELGQQARLRDEIMWYIQGLSSPSEIHSSLAKIVELYNNRRNRMALESSDMGKEVVRELAKIKIQDDPLAALGISTIFLLLAYPSGNPMVFSDPQIARMMSTILECDSFLLNEQKTLAPATAILRILTEPPINRILPKEIACSPLAVTLLALTSVLDPQHSVSDAEELKVALCKNQVLHAAAQVIAVHGSALGEAAPTMKTVFDLWHLQHALIVLEHSSFACRNNEEVLASMDLSFGMAPFVARISLPTLLIQQLRDLIQRPLTEGLKKDCLRSILAVLMNITQANEAGCTAVTEANGVEICCQTFYRIVSNNKLNSPSSLKTIHELSAWVDELTVSLGLLINLAEPGMANRIRMRSIDLYTENGEISKEKDDYRCTRTTNEGMINLLCNLISAIIDAEKSEESHDNSSCGDEVTLESLNRSSGEATSSIIRLYSAVLLGFLIEGDGKVQEEAARLLPQGNLIPVVSAVQQCLGFYLATGALTKNTEESLRTLLGSLQQSPFI